MPLRDEEQYQVYKLYAIPDLKYQLKPRLEEKLVVMNHDSTRYMELTEMELFQCRTSGCNKPSLVRLSSISECGVAQILNKTTDTCGWEPISHDVSIIQTEKGVLYSIPNAYSCSVSCNKQFAKRITVSNAGFIKLAPGCEATMLNLHGHQTYKIEGPPMIINLEKIEPIRFFDEMRMRKITSPVAKRLSEVYVIKKALDESISTYQVISEHRNKITRYAGLIIFAAISVIGTIMVCAICLICKRIGSMGNTTLGQWLFPCCCNQTTNSESAINELSTPLNNTVTLNETSDSSAVNSSSITHVSGTPQTTSSSSIIRISETPQPADTSSSPARSISATYPFATRSSTRSRGTTSNNESSQTAAR